MRRSLSARRERGASALELSILAPVLLLVIWWIIQGALYLFGASIAQNAAEWGVSQLRIYDPSVYTVARREAIESQTELYAKSLGGNSLREPRAEATYDEEAGIVTVKVTGYGTSLTGVELKVTKTATGRIETFLPDCGEAGEPCGSVDGPESSSDPNE